MQESRTLNQSRQHHLDALRGVVALLVVVAHYFVAFYPYTIFGNHGIYQQRSIWENIFFYPPFGLLVAGNFAVCTFFILSGYVLSYKYLGEIPRIKGIIAAMIKRPIRLGGLVLFTIILSSCLWYSGLYFNNAVSEITHSKPWFSHFWHGSFELRQLVKNIVTSLFSNGAIYNPPLWTIPIELYGSILVFLFVLLFGNFKYRLLIVGILLIFLKSTFYVGFLLGIIIADIVKNHHFISKLKSKNIISIVLLILFLYFSSYPSYVYPDFMKGTIYKILPDVSRFGGGYPMLSALLLFILVTINRQIKNVLHTPLLQSLGRVSYGLYVIHFLVIGSLSSWLFLRLNDDLGYSRSFALVLLFGIPISVLLAYWTTIYIDTPVIKFASDICKKISALVNVDTNHFT